MIVFVNNGVVPAFHSICVWIMHTPSALEILGFRYVDENTLPREGLNNLHKDLLNTASLVSTPICRDHVGSQLKSFKRILNKLSLLQRTMLAACSHIWEYSSRHAVISAHIRWT